MKDISKHLLAVAELRARAGLKDLAALLDSSEQLVQYHLRRLHDEKHILGFNAIVDHAKIGRTFHLLYLRFFDLSYDQERKWLQHVAAKISGVALVARSVGRWSAIVGVVSKSNRELLRISSEVCRFASGKIAEFSATSEVMCTYSSLRLLADRKAVQVATSDNEEPATIDELDERILSILAYDCRVGATEIARRVSSSPTTVLRRIELMEEARVVLGYRVHIDYERFGFHQYRVLLRLSDLSSAIHEKVRRHLLATGVVESVSRYLGMADLDFRCYASSLEQLGEFMANLRDKFSGIIINSEIVPVFYWRRMNYFPGQLSE